MGKESSRTVLRPDPSIERDASCQPYVARVASFFWIESRACEAGRRRLVFDLDQSIMQSRAKAGESETALKLTSRHHNLLRM
jgi:predicted 2-oxoglutarate/Fe(II)-dependent dioxygenase YbiX